MAVPATPTFDLSDIMREDAEVGMAAATPGALPPLDPTGMWSLWLLIDDCLSGLRAEMAQGAGVAPIL